MDLRSSIAAASACVVLAACANNAETADPTATPTPDAAAETVTVTETVRETITAAVSETVTVTETVTAEATEDPPATDETEGPTETSALPPPAQPLGLSHFYNPGQSWEQGRYNIANRDNEQGISVDLAHHQDSRLELRLENKFTSLEFDAAQANDSRNSDCVTKVDIFVNGELRETREFPFNAIQEFRGIDVTGGNAVIIECTLQDCYGSARIVLSNIEVS